MNRTSKFSKHGLTTLGLILTSVVIGCSAAKKAPAVGAGANEQKTMKPDRVAVTRVGVTVLGELSHIERAMKPFLGVTVRGASAGDAPPEVEALAAGGLCKKTKSTSAAQWETRWQCGLDSTVRGRKEIEGVERLNYDSSKRVLTYDAKFTTRNFDDQEPREKAHALVTGRKIRIKFAAESSSATAIGTVRIASAAAVENFDLAREGSNWSSSVGGIIRRSGSAWTLDKGAIISLRGALYGLDGERKTMFASGEFNFVSETDVSLLGLDDSTCTKPVGTWQVNTIGGGETFNTTLASTSTTVFESSGGSLNWPMDLCEQP